MASHFEDCLEYWDYWWERAPDDRLTRPEIIADDDPILQQTVGSLFVDTISHHDFFDSFLCTALQGGHLPRGSQVPRADYQDAVIQLLSSRGVAMPDRTIVFVGGGYGAGKTTVLTMKAKRSFLPLPQENIIGVDAFKLYLPEYEAIRRIGDGRASSIVQEEARKLSDGAFHLLIRMGRSFMWDSSMSDLEATRQRIAAARGQGYRLILVGVGCPIEAAIRKALFRARQTRRFAHPAHLENSHRNFALAFDTYFDLFDKVMLFWNPWKPGDNPCQPRLIAEKDCGDNSLVSYGWEELELFRSLSEK